MGVGRSSSRTEARLQQLRNRVASRPSSGEASAEAVSVPEAFGEPLASGEESAASGPRGQGRSAQGHGQPSPAERLDIVAIPAGPAAAEAVGTLLASAAAAKPSRALVVAEIVKAPEPLDEETEDPASCGCSPRADARSEACPRNAEAPSWSAELDRAASCPYLR